MMHAATGSDGVVRDALSAGGAPPDEDHPESPYKAYATRLPRFLVRFRNASGDAWSVDMGDELGPRPGPASGLLKRLSEGTQSPRETASLLHRARAGGEGEVVDLAHDARAFVEAVGGPGGLDQWFELLSHEQDLAHMAWLARTRVESVSEAKWADHKCDFLYDQRSDSYGSSDELVDAGSHGLFDALGPRPFDDGEGDAAWDVAAGEWTRRSAPPYHTATALERWPGLSRDAVDDLVEELIHEGPKRFVNALLDAAVCDVEDNHHEDASDDLVAMDDLGMAGSAFVRSPRADADLAAFHTAVEAWNARQHVVSHYPVPTLIVRAFPDVEMDEVRAFEARFLRDAETELARVPDLLTRPVKPREEVIATLGSDVQILKDDCRAAWRWIRYAPGGRKAAAKGPWLPTFELAFGNLQGSVVPD